MPPKRNGPPQTANPSEGNKTVSYEIAKKVCSQEDMNRLACAFLNSGNLNQYDSEAAAEQFGTGAKAASFRRQMWNIITKIKNYEEDLTEANESNAGSPEPKSKTGGKRKAAAEEDAGQEGKVKKASKTKKKPEIKEELETDEQSGGEASGNPL